MRETCKFRVNSQHLDLNILLLPSYIFPLTSSLLHLPSYIIRNSLAEQATIPES